MSADAIGEYIVIAGAHPLAELTLYGPFDSSDDAEAWANTTVAQIGDWWIAPVWKAQA